MLTVALNLILTILRTYDRTMIDNSTSRQRQNRLQGMDYLYRQATVFPFMYLIFYTENLVKLVYMVNLCLYTWKDALQ